MYHLLLSVWGLEGGIAETQLFPTLTWDFTAVTFLLPPQKLSIPLNIQCELVGFSAVDWCCNSGQWGGQELSFGGISAFRVSHGRGLCLRDAFQVPEIPEQGNLGFRLSSCWCLRASFPSVNCKPWKVRGISFSVRLQGCLYAVSLPQNSLCL